MQTRHRCASGARRARLYADIVGPHLLDPYRLADPIVRPGMRVLDARCSTGFGAAALAARVGPSGAVVALDPDHESIRYARRRYTDSNIAWEIGGIGSLEGELDGSFDVVIAANAIRKGGDAPRAGGGPLAGARAGRADAARAAAADLRQPGQRRAGAGHAGGGRAQHRSG
ncbi:MAG: methyltransferase domain-containing protein [Planctomycetota bacterium]|nr:MAG: methyltransferase domain-containing protein [Planctomycetota bacterium]